MSKFIDIQNSFSKGMLSPKLRGRIDIPEYKQGAEEITNALGFKQGGLYRRPASEYLNDFANSLPTASMLIPIASSKEFLTVDSSNEPRIIGYYGDTGSGDFEVLDTFNGTIPPISFYNNALQRGNEYNGDAITFSSEDVTDYMTIGTTTIITRKEDPPLVIYKASWLVGTGVKFIQSGFKLHLLSLPIDNTNLTFIDPSTTTTLSEALSMPYLPANTDTAKTFAASATTGTITLTTNFKVKDGNKSSFIGRYIKIKSGTTTGVVRLTSTDTSRSTTVGQSTFTGMVIVTLGGTAASNDWQMSIEPYFNSLVVHQQRLCLSSENIVYGSQIGNLQNFMITKLYQDSSSDISGLGYYGTAAATDPFEFAIAARDKEVIQWLESGEDLEVGTDKREYVIKSSESAALSSSNVQIKQQTTFGSYNARPIKTNKSTIVISKEQNYIRRFERNLSGSDTYQTFELNLHADNIISDVKFKKVVYQSESSVIWFITEDNELISCTYHEEAEVICWAKHEIAGTDVAIIDIAANLFEDPILFEDSGEIYLIIDRTIDGSTVRYFERIGREFRSDNLFESAQLAAFSDSCLKVVISPATNTVTGLDHLEGETIDVLVNGILEEDLVVSSGQVTTTNSGTEFVCGLPFETTIKTMPIEVGGQFGTSQSSIKRINEIFFKFYNTKGVTVSDAEGNNSYPLNFGDETVSTLESGDLSKNVQIKPDYNNQFIVKQSKSLPMNLLAFVARGQSYD